MFCVSVFNHFKNELKNLDGNYLEIGVFNGDSIALLAASYPNKTIVGIDPFIEDGYTIHTTGVDAGQRIENQHQSTKNYIAGFNNIKFYEMTSKDFFNQITDELVETLNISGVLIDGDHHYEHVYNDAMLALRMIGDKSGHIAFDDTNLTDIITVMNEFRELVKDRITNEYKIGDGNQHIFEIGKI